MPAENFPSECADLRRAFEEVVSTAAVVSKRLFLHYMNR